MAKIIRYCKLKEEHSGENVFDCSRPYIFGNPYTHIRNKETKALVKVKTRDEAIDLYEPYFDKMIETNEELNKEYERMYEMLKKHGTIYLGCFCELNERCHTEIIEKRLKQRIVKDGLKKIMDERKKTISDSSQRTDSP